MNAEAPTPKQLYYYRFERAGMSPQEASHLIGVSNRTLRRWEHGQARIPLATFRLVKMYANGIRNDGSWKGWTADKQAIYTPEETRITAGEIRAIPLLKQLICELKQQLELERGKPARAPVFGVARSGQPKDGLQEEKPDTRRHSHNCQ